MKERGCSKEQKAKGENELFTTYVDDFQII